MKNLLTSKKFWVAFGGLVAIIVSTLVGLPEAESNINLFIMAIVNSYVIGQGIADHGKEKAKVESKNDIRV